MNKDNCFYSNLTDKAEVLWLHAFYSSLDVKNGGGESEFYSGRLMELS